MFGWAVTFLILAVIAAYLGFFGLAGLAAVIVKFLLFIFLILLAGSGLLSLIRRKAPGLESFRFEITHIQRA
jgi:uncharacterized membrane protein YtjA (UPF0391 family)